MSPHPKAKAIMSTHRKITMSSPSANSDTSKRGLAILFAAIDYHQSTTSSSSSLLSPSYSSSTVSTNTYNNNPFHQSNIMDQHMRKFIESRAVNPTMLDEEFAFPKRGNNVDIQWMDEGNLSLKQRKMNRRSWKRFQSKKQQNNNNKNMSTEMALSIPLPDSLTVVESNSPVIVHTTTTVSPSSSIGSTPTTLFDDQASADDGSIGIAPIESEATSLHQDDSMITQEDITQATTVYQPTVIPSSPRRRISIETVDGFDALLKRQQQRLYNASQKTERSRAMLRDMTVRS